MCVFSSLFRDKCAFYSNGGSCLYVVTVLEQCCFPPNNLHVAFLADPWRGHEESSLINRFNRPVAEARSARHGGTRRPSSSTSWPQNGPYLASAFRIRLRSREGNELDRRKAPRRIFYSFRVARVRNDRRILDFAWKRTIARRVRDARLPKRRVERSIDTGRDLCPFSPLPRTFASSRTETRDSHYSRHFFFLFSFFSFCDTQRLEAFYLPLVLLSEAAREKNERGKCSLFQRRETNRFPL